MALARRARHPIVAFPVPLTCHVATWYWAAREAARRGLTPNRQVGARAANIGGLPNGPQLAMLALPRDGTVTFSGPDPMLPPPGTVLLWEDAPTHSAIVTAHGITGYNQACVFAPYITHANYSSGHPTQLRAEYRTCYTISEDTIVRAAGGVFHL